MRIHRVDVAPNVYKGRYFIPIRDQTFVMLIASCSVCSINKSSRMLVLVLDAIATQEVSVDIDRSKVSVCIDRGKCLY